MKCARCGGIMYYEKIYSDAIERSWGWSCISCGEHIDRVILENRRWQDPARGDSPAAKGAPVPEIR